MDYWKLQRGCLWCGPIFIVLFAGSLAIAGWLPIPSPNQSAAEVTASISDNLFRTRLGVLIMMLSVAFIAPWGIVLALQSWRFERGKFPIFVIIQIVGLTLWMCTMIMYQVSWEVATFRPGSVSPEVTQAFWDQGWLWFWWPDGFYLLWSVSMAFTMLSDDRAEPVYPRWLGWLTLANASAISLTLLVIFFKSGPFAWRGLISCYFVLTIFFIWLIALTVMGFKAVNRAERRATGRADEKRSAVPSGALATG